MHGITVVHFYKCYYKRMNIATVAYDTIWKDPAKNVENTELHVKNVLKKHPKTDVILFPEISLMGAVVDAQVGEIAEKVDGYCVSAIQRIARKYSVALVCGMIEQNPSGGKPYNCQFVVDKKGVLIANYHKNHLFTASAEPQLYSAGQELVLFNIDGWKCGLTTCFDIRFPRLFEAYKRAGVEIIFSGFNWVNGRNKPEIMKNLVMARAHENQIFFVAVDRSGSDPNTSYYGTTIIATPYCENIAEIDDIYGYAEVTKDDIKTLSLTLPLTDSFKSEYNIS